MKKLQAILAGVVFVLGFFLANVVHAVVPDADALSAIEATDTIPSSSLPMGALYYSAANPNGPPMPGSMGYDAWQIDTNTFLLDDLDSSSGFSGRGMGMMDDSSPPGFGDGGDGGGDYPSYTNTFSFPTNGLWLQITNVSGGLATVNLMNATDSVYEIFSKTDLTLTNWTIEQEVWPGDTNCMPFIVPESNRTNLFLWARDWTGITSNGNTTPEWWFWEYFGTTDLSDTNVDSTGYNTLNNDYTYGVDPNVIGFSIAVTNNYVNSMSAPVQLNITGGTPFYYAVLVNDTNQADALWQPYAGTNITVSLNDGDGVYAVRVGLRGLPANATTTWLETQLTLFQPPPLTLAVTNPIASTVSVPLIQLQGLVNQSLGNLTYDVSNALGVVTNQQGYWNATFFNANVLSFTTNTFQCYDIPLTNGLNTITLHATDMSGNVTTTNVSFTLSYSGDTTAPVLAILWPTNGTVISGSNFTLQAQMDDATATVTASMNGQTNAGIVERSGAVWFNNLPLTSGTNLVTVTAQDAAGNVSVTNLNVIGNDVGLVVDPISGDQLNLTNVSVTGSVGNTNDSVSVNGVAAYFTDDIGDWEADGVSVSATGTAGLNVQVTDADNNPLAAVNVYQPQPAMVEASSYQDTEASADSLIVPSGCGNSVGGSGSGSTDWILGVGGRSSSEDSSGDSYEEDLGPNWAQGAGLTWQNSSVNESYAYVDNSDCSRPEIRSVFSMETTQTHVIIAPSGQQSIGQTMLYLVQAQVMDEDTGLQLAASAVRFMHQLAGTATTDVTNSDDGSVWTTAVVSAPAGAPLKVTPKASGNISFNAMQVFKTKEAWQRDVRNEIYSDTGGKADMNTYNPANGFMYNRTNLQAVYAFYQKLFTENGNLLWAGLGKLAGAPVYAGLSDAEFTKENSIALSIFTAITGGLGTNDLTTFQNTLITMNTNILQDLAWQSEAYYKGGLQALGVIYAGETNALDLLTINAWREIDDGISNNIASEIQNGNLQLAHREQFTILQPIYNTLNGAVTNLMSTLAKNPVPTGTNFVTVVPGGQLSIFADRWNWITNNAGGIWPSWVAADSITQSNWVNIPLTTRASTYVTYLTVY